MWCQNFQTTPTLTVILFALIVFAGSRHAIAEDEASKVDRVSVAIRKAVPLLESAAAGSAKEKRCFTCHSQALPVFALAEAQNRGFKIDQEVLTSQVKHTVAHLKRGLKGYREGRGQGGRVMTAGYALWTLEAGDWDPDETTAAVSHYLLEFQKDDKRWHRESSRPPSAGSDFANTYLALRALRNFATEEQQPAKEARIADVGEWLLATQAKDTEDRVFRFRALSYFDSEQDQITAERNELISQQREDGGWSQKPEMPSDAYATGSVLAALLRDGASRSGPMIERGVTYLLDSQLEDGSWHVVTRAKPFQPYFETGFPHKKDQFISTAATGWATIALALTLPETELETSKAE
jgi:N-acyl-D-amino-acid deacylase